MYPPKRHYETDINKMYRVIEEFSLATLVSNTENEALITHAPLVLDKTKGEKGILLGHMDRLNPQAAYLNGRDIKVIFHGPNAYISPHVYKTSQLPTWNYVIVHLKGKVTEVNSQADLLNILVGVSRIGDRSENAYILDKNDKRIDKMIDYIIGFQIEIETMDGRFKLSQDREMPDVICAKNRLIAKSLEGHEDFIEDITTNIPSNLT